MKNIWILAQAQDSESITSEPVGSEETQTVTTDAKGDPNTGTGTARGPSPYSSLIMFGLLFLVMYLFLFRGPRKKQQQHQKMVKSLKKNDKVRTIGGIIGTVVDIKDNEITLKVDESNNTKIKVIPSAIGKNLIED
jgi:preprotein translocase subunit YajC